MTSITTLARPYAKAAFDLASQGPAGQDLANWDAALTAAATVVTDPAMADWLERPDLDRAQVLRLLDELCGNQAGASFKAYLEVLAANSRLGLLPEISRLYVGLREDAENRLNVRVVSAIPLAQDQSERLAAALGKRYQRTIELQNEVDPALLGGAVVYAGEDVIDGSVRGRLGRLERSLA